MRGREAGSGDHLQEAGGDGLRGREDNLGNFLVTRGSISFFFWMHQQSTWSAHLSWDGPTSR